MRWFFALCMACVPVTGSASVPDAPCEGSSQPHLRATTLPERARFDAWLPAHGASFRAFEDTLRAAGVLDVVEPWTLWYQGTSWESGGHPPFVEPPREDWPAIVPTLRILRDAVIPVTGPLCVVSGYRTSAYNASEGGAKASKHMGFHGVDVLPAREWTRAALHGALKRLHVRVGPSRKMGLGLYSGVRFHVDAWRYRSW
jgi:hypothetical protein